jgi:DNA-binding XRE family transcriptional regulator
MATKFADFMRSLESEAKREGPEAVAELEALREHVRIGRKLAEARLAKKLTQKQVATRAKIDQGDVSKIERGHANPTMKTLSAFAQAVGYQIDLRRFDDRTLAKRRRSPRSRASA